MIVYDHRTLSFTRRNRGLRQSGEIFDYVIRLQTDGDGGIERIGSKFVLVNVCRAANRFGDGDEEVLRVLIDGREGLEEHVPVRRDPKRPRRVV